MDHIILPPVGVLIHLIDRKLTPCSNAILINLVQIRIISQFKFPFRMFLCIDIGQTIEKISEHNKTDKLIENNGPNEPLLDNAADQKYVQYYSNCFIDRSFKSGFMLITHNDFVFSHNRILLVMYHSVVIEPCCTPHNINE